MPRPVKMTRPQTQSKIEARASEVNLMKLKLVFFFAITLLSQTAFGQCATGINAGGGACIPPDAPGMPGYQQQPPVQVRPVWRDQWGALALNEGTGEAGFVDHLSSRREAKKSALAYCRANGSSNCKIMLTFHNQCAAVAQGESAGFARGPDQKVTEKGALAHCGKSKPCKIIYSACNYPDRIR